LENRLDTIIEHLLKLQVYAGWRRAIRRSRSEIDQATLTEDQVLGGCFPADPDGG
jgi:hypothetical protein